MIQIILNKPLPVEMARLDDLILNNYIICRESSRSESMQVLMSTNNYGISFYFADYADAMFAVSSYATNDMFNTRRGAVMHAINAGGTVFAFDSISEFTKYALERV